MTAEFGVVVLSNSETRTVTDLEGIYKAAIFCHTRWQRDRRVRHSAANRLRLAQLDKRGAGGYNSQWFIHVGCHLFRIRVTDSQTCHPPASKTLRQSLPPSRGARPERTRVPVAKEHKSTKEAFRLLAL